MTYRIKQFLWAISASFKDLDYKYVEKYLNTYEINLFKRLKKSEQSHCIKVSKDCIKLAKDKGIESNKELNSFARVGLLHDIGKLDYPLNVVTKSFLVLGKKLSKNKLSKFQNIKAVDIYYNHGNRAFKYLREKEYNEKFIEAIENHHYTVTKKNILLEVLKQADDMN